MAKCHPRGATISAKWLRPPTGATLPQVAADPLQPVKPSQKANKAAWVRYAEQLGYSIPAGTTKKDLIRLLADE